MYDRYVAVKTCPVLRAPLHGSVKCEHDEDQHQFDEDSTVYPIDTRCQFNCDVGYQLRGSKVRNCLPVSRWDGLKVTCKGKKKAIVFRRASRSKRDLKMHPLLIRSCEMRASTASRERRCRAGDMRRSSEDPVRHQLHDHVPQGLRPGRTHQQILQRPHRNLDATSHRESMRRSVSREGLSFDLFFFSFHLRDPLRSRESLL